MKCLKDIEHRSHLRAAELGLDREADLVTGPHNVLGIELNEYAAELARVTVWIGELQWRLAHGYEFKTNPVLDTLEHIECRDALLAWPAEPAESDPTFPDAAAQALGATRTTQALGVTHAAQALGATSAAQALGATSAAQALGAAHAAQALDATSAAQALGSDHDFAQRNSGSDPKPGPPPTAANPHEASWPRADVVIGNPPFLGDRKMIRELGEDYTATLRKTYADRVPGGADLVCYWFDKARAQIATGALQRAGLVATNSIRGGANRKVLDAICAQTRIFEAWSDEPWVNNGAAVRVSLIAFGQSEQDSTLDGRPTQNVASNLTPLDHSTSSDLTEARKLHENNGTSFIGTQKNGPFDIPGELARRHFPFPAGLTPADTAHQRTEAVAGGTLIPADLSADLPSEAPGATTDQNLEPNRPPALIPRSQAAIKTITLRETAIAIAQAAQRLNTLREAWLNPPEWTTRVPEVVPLGLSASPYPDRTVAKAGFEKELAQRTLTKLYNQRPAWLAAAHAQLDAAVAAAYGWLDYTSDMAHDEILRRLLALNLARSAAASA